MATKYTQNNNTQNNIPNTPIKRQRYRRRVPLIEPVKYGPIKIIENSINGYVFISYTDCFEISLLRFLHVLFGRNGQINLNYLKNFTGENELYNYFLINPNYNNNSDYYETYEGFKLRADWCSFLNNRHFFQYKKENKYEVCASFNNLISFVHYFIPNIKTPNTNTIHIENYLNFLFRQINNNIIFKYVLFKEVTDNIYMNTTLNISINGKHIYDWEVYQYFNKNTCERITGHSDFRMAI
jgi:hypothetical protein